MRCACHYLGGGPFRVRRAITSVPLRSQTPEQVAMERAAELMDRVVAIPDETWEQHASEMAECFRSAGLHETADFVDAVKQ